MCLPPDKYFSNAQQVSVMSSLIDRRAKVVLMDARKRKEEKVFQKSDLEKPFSGFRIADILDVRQYTASNTVRDSVPRAMYSP